jgi:hypothetical protein
MPQRISLLLWHEYGFSDQTIQMGFFRCAEKEYKWDSFAVPKKSLNGGKAAGNTGLDA